MCSFVMKQFQTINGNTWKGGILGLGGYVPRIPVLLVLFEWSHQAMEIGQFVKFCDVIPTCTWQPTAWIIKLIVPVYYLQKCWS